MMSNWSDLSKMSEQDCELAATLFKTGCETLGVDSCIINELCDVVAACIPAEIYANLTPTPSIEGIETVMDNAKAYLGDAAHTRLRAEITSLAIEKRDDRLSIDSNTHAFAVLTLMNVMAACSKLGAGNEDSISILDGSQDLAKILLEDTAFVKTMCNYTKSYKKHDPVTYHSLMVPLMFANAVLLSKDALKTNLLLPKNLMEFQSIQAHWFGDCLTEASLKARMAYETLLRSTTYQTNPWLSTVMSEHLEHALLTVNDEALKTIEQRIQLAEEGHYPELQAHYNVAVSWLRSPFKMVLSEKNILPSLDRDTPHTDTEDHSCRATPCSSPQHGFWSLSQRDRNESMDGDFLTNRF